MAVPSIVSVTTVDADTLEMTLAAVPTGALTVKGKRAPALTGNTCTVIATAAPTVFRLEDWWSSGVETSFGLWYFVATDTVGSSAVAALWHAWTNPVEVACGWLRDTILANQVGLEAAWSDVSNELGIVTISRAKGQEARRDGLNVELLAKGETVNPYLDNYGDRIHAEVEIVPALIVDDRVSQNVILTRVGWAFRSLLNSRACRDVTVAGAWELNNGHVEGYAIEETWLEDRKMSICAVRLQWSGEMLQFSF
jgi:hypothetical protein